MPTPAAIRTPDHRLRVFVSSTLSELADERGAVRAAVERLHLTPVMFELGARPHAPRSLYRAYLDQSHVFVGIYWQRYGWIAPGEQISGLEDEYRLAGTRPRLLYIKQPAPNADARLLELIDDFATDDLASFKKFGSAGELSELVANDLAVLLTERFEESSTEPQPELHARIPSPAYPIVDRGREMQHVTALVRSGTRLITLTGIGGIGKSRLAIEIARALSDEIRIVFVRLSAVNDSEEAIRKIAESVCLRLERATSKVREIANHLGGESMLLVLDNIEQIAGIGPLLGRLLEEASELQILATSRKALRIRAEQEVRVLPFAVPESRGRDEANLSDEPAIRLFLDRAAAVGQPIALSPEHAEVLVDISRRLEGVPLAIELAAAWTKLLTPRALLERLDDPLALLVGGSVDAPERHRTLRATVEWSYNLLEESERILLARLSIFANGWTIEGAEAVCATAEIPVLETLSSLLDASLVTPQGASASAPRFMMFEPVRSYAAERLDAAGERAAMADRHLDYYCALGARAQPALCGRGQRKWVERLDPERPDLRRAVATALAVGRHASVVELAWDVVVLYFVLDAVHEPASWLQHVVDAEPVLDTVTAAKLRSLLALTKIHEGRYEGAHADLSDALRVFRELDMEFEAAVTLHQIGFVRYRVEEDESAAIDALRESSAIFDRLGHDWGVALVESMLASVLAAIGELSLAAECGDRALARARAIENEPLLVQAFHQLSFIRLLEQRELDAFELLDTSAPLLRRNGLRTDASYCLDALALIALVEGDVATAAEAVAKAALERNRLRVAPWPTLAPSISRVAEAARRRIGSEAFEATHEAMASRDVFEVLDGVLEKVRTAVGTNSASLE